MNQQRTPEWYAARLGKVTASRIDAVMATGKGGGPSLTRAAYLADLLLERLTGQPAESYRSADMERGLVRLMPEAKPLQLEWEKLPWNEGRTDYATGFSDHLADAALYAWRASPAYAHRNPSDEKVPTEEEREDIALAKMDEEMFSDAKEGRNAWMKKIVRGSR